MTNAMHAEFHSAPVRLACAWVRASAAAAEAVRPQVVVRPDRLAAAVRVRRPDRLVAAAPVRLRDRLAMAARVRQPDRLAVAARVRPLGPLVMAVPVRQPGQPVAAPAHLPDRMAAVALGPRATFPTDKAARNSGQILGDVPGLAPQCGRPLSRAICSITSGFVAS